MILTSDFEEYYDKEILNYGGIKDVEFVRMSNMNFSKKQQLELLEKIGYSIINIMPLRQMFTDGKILVYTNPDLHNGMGKSIMSLSDALVMYRNSLCTELFDHSTTYKILQVGFDCFSLEIENEDLKEARLKSCILLGNGLPGLVNNKYPMYSIDFVQDNNGKLLACDLDVAVKLSHIEGLSECIKAEYVAEKLYRYLISRQEV